MSTLLLRLAAPMQSWGAESKFDTRDTRREPTKSGVIGLLAAACGIRRDDIAALQELNKLRFGVRADREGQLLHDFHMARGEKSSYVTHRYYLCDAVFLCGLEADDRVLLEQYAAHLLRPSYPLFLGRRSCPPTLPLVLGIRDCGLEAALRQEPRLTEEKGSVRLELEADSADPAGAVCKDVPLSFSPRRREYGYRKYREEILPGEQRTEHNPFAEVEAENVSDTHGA